MNKNHNGQRKSTKRQAMVDITLDRKRTIEQQSHSH